VRGSISARSAEKSKKIYRILSKKILNLPDDANESPQYRRAELPEFLLDTESGSLAKHDHDLPSALINLIRSVKVFGYFDQKIILEMCKYMETRTVYANNYLFKIGEQDDSIYVVESGRVNVYITDEKGRKHLIKECTEGSHIFSLLSIMDVLTGDTKPYRTVSAKAVEDTSILRLPGKAFVDVLQKYPDYLVRITQIIIVRLQRVTFTALHSYLGLTSEIMNNSLEQVAKKTPRRTKFQSSDMAINHPHHQHHRVPPPPPPPPQSQSQPASSAHELKESSETNVDDGHHHHHHHHHHYHHYHGKGGAPAEDLLQRKQSIPLPPVSLFADERDQAHDHDFTQTRPAAEISTQTSVVDGDHTLPPEQVIHKAKTPPSPFKSKTSLFLMVQ
jgi:CRP-like cAMP-binding protein